MQFNMDYEISALIILCVVGYLQIFGRKAKIKRSRIFLSMTVIEMLTVIFNLISKGLLNRFGETIFDVVRPVIGCYYMLQYSLAILIMVYMVVWSGRSVKKNGLEYVLFLAPILVYAEECARNFLTAHLYYYDAACGFLETSNISVLNGVVVYCMLFGIVYSVRYARFNSFGKLTTVAILCLLTGIAVFAQASIQHVVFIDFVVAIVLLILYYVAQNPSDMLDHNTQLLNRNMMEELFEADIIAGRDFDLIVLALDDFKFVNKTFGVTVGDMLLMQVAHFLTTTCHKGNVFRYGSDQFAVQIHSGKEEPSVFLDAVLERFRHPWITEDVSVMLSTTISYISCPQDGDQLEAVIDVIDYSVLCAKKNGKGSIVYAKDMDLHALRKEKAIEKAVDLAIEQDTIEVYYQPIYNTEKQKYTSAEALVRIHDDLLGNISPEIFIPIAEKNGSIVKMGAMIFEKVCKFISEHKLAESTIEYIEVNVSVVQCMQQDFVETLNDIMEYYGVKPEQINLEVTETAAVNSITVLQENIEKLHDQGISFSLDDYGSGYATIGYIHRLPFRMIKLDKCMVWDAFENERAGITLKHTVGMLKELDLNIVAEGVETQEQQSRLSNIGCDYLQGWYYSKAIPEKEFARLIEEAC